MLILIRQIMQEHRRQRQKKDSKKEDKRDLTAPVISGTADKTFTSEIR